MVKVGDEMVQQHDFDFLNFPPSPHYIPLQNAEQSKRPWQSLKATLYLEDVGHTKGTSPKYDLLQISFHELLRDEFLHGPSYMDA